MVSTYAVLDIDFFLLLFIYFYILFCFSFGFSGFCHTWKKFFLKYPAKLAVFQATFS